MKTKRVEVCDVIATVAWQCGEKGCTSPGGWHRGSYWIDTNSPTGYTYDEFADGDHDDCEESDIPSGETIGKGWRDYSAWVLENGQDPLGEFFVRPTRKVRERWEFKFRPCIGGVRLIAARHAGRDVSPRELPDHVARFLDLIPGSAHRIAGFASYKEFEAAGLPLGRWHVDHVDHEVPNPNYVRELKAAARKHLRRKA